MDPQSENFYKNIYTIAGIVVVSFIISLIFNYFMLTTFRNINPNSVGFPFDSGQVSDSNLDLRYFGLFANVIVWTAAFSIIFPVLKLIFIREK